MPPVREGPDELRKLLLRELLECDELPYPRLRPDEKLALLPLLELRELLLELRELLPPRLAPLPPPLPMFGLLAATVAHPP